MKRFSIIFIALFAFLFLGSAPSAMAHEDIQVTDPATNELLEAGVIPIVLTFSEPVMIMDGNEGTEIQVTDEAGTNQNAGCLQVRENMVSAMVELDQTGEYTVTWRTVSSDGHPIDGSYKFKIQNTSNYEATGQIPCPFDVAMPASGEETAMPIAAPAEDGGNTLVGLFIGLGFVVVGSVAGALGIKLRERNAARRRELPTED